MKRHSLIRLFAYIITALIFSALPALVNAQKKCPDGNCPKGQVCVNGHCEKFQPFCPPCYRLDKGECVPCRSCCMWLSSPLRPNQSPSASLSVPSTINILLSGEGPVTIKIYDMTGRLVKTLANDRMPEGYHEIEWDNKDESGQPVPAGVYILQIITNGQSEIMKLSIVK